MGLKLGNINIGEIYLGSTKIKEIYLGSTKVYTSSITPPTTIYPYFTFEFADGTINPNNITGKLVNSYYLNNVIWTQLSSSPNVWRIEITSYNYVQEQMGMGISCLFTSGTGEGTGYLTMSCKLIDSGNFDYTDMNSNRCTSFDRTFAGCTGLTQISTIQYSSYFLFNVGGMFKGCTNVTTGALAQYNYFNTYASNIANHSGTFTDCGKDTQTGLLELQQIPVGWGGLLEPISTVMTVAVDPSSGNKVRWKLVSDGPDFTTDTGIYVYTSNSISQYAGVSMNRSRLYNKINGFSNSTSYNEYYRICFVQIPGRPTSSSTYQPTWILTTSGVNGTLPAYQSNTDMPGTLDYNTYGPMDKEYGTYDANQDVYLAILVTNDDPVTWSGLNDGMAFLYNASYLTDPSFKWFK